MSKEEKTTQKVNEEIGVFGMWVNDHIVGNPITFVIAILSVVIVYALIPVIGYAKWNTGIGLFYNTLSSSFELITGVGAVVGVVVLHSKHQKHTKEIKTNMDSIHVKLDALAKSKNVPADKG